MGKLFNGVGNAFRNNRDAVNELTRSLGAMISNIDHAEFPFRKLSPWLNLDLQNRASLFHYERLSMEATHSSPSMSRNVALRERAAPRSRHNLISDGRNGSIGARHNTPGEHNTIFVRTNTFHRSVIHLDPSLRSRFMMTSRYKIIFDRWRQQHRSYSVGKV